MPKPERLRQGRRRYAGEGWLTPEAPIAEAPRLPAGRKWHPEVRAWWTAVWESPVAKNYLRVDVHGLRMLAVLMEAFWREGRMELGPEIRLQAGLWGLDSLSRRKLGWEKRDGENEGEKRNTDPPRYQQRADPRTMLHVVAKRDGDGA